MKHLIPDRPLLPPDGPDGSPQSSSSPPRRGALSHRQARGRLALVLDPTTEPELLAALQQHLAGCERCRGELDDLRHAEAWFLAQPVEAPPMAAAQEAVWAALQARITADGAAAPASNGHLNGHALVPLVSQPANTPPDVPAAAEQPAALVPLLPAPLPTRPASKTSPFTPMKALIAVLAASFLMSSLALLVVHLSTGSASNPPNARAVTPPLSDILDPGNVTLALSFDPASRRLFSLTSDLRAACNVAQCADLFSTASACVRMSSLEADTGQRTWSLVPACMSAPAGTSGGDTFTALYEDTALGQVALLDSAGRVTTLNAGDETTATTYHLACCTLPTTQSAQTVLDTRDHLLLTATTSQGSALATLAAQQFTSGQVAYQVPLDGNQLQGAVFSAVTGWLYLWTDCAADAETTCVEVYQAGSGRRVTGWPAPAHSSPLAADPVDDVLYVQETAPGSAGETLMLDGRSGAPVGQLPPAQSIALNGLLHHAYLLDQDGVTVVDTRSRRKLSTLPVPAHDGALWATPAVDERYDRVYLPTLRGKVLTALDDPAGHLRLSSPALQATLDAERAVTNSWMADNLDLDPADLPVGPGAFTFYYSLEQTQATGCKHMAVPARTESAATPLRGGDFTVTISLAWGSTDSPSATLQPVNSPPAQASYPHQHTWLYRIPASGGAQWTSEQGERLPQC